MKHPKNTAILNYKYHNEEGTKVNEKEWNVNAGLCTSGAYGIGCFSKEAYEFVDILKEAGQKLWQILLLDRQDTVIHRISLSTFAKPVFYRSGDADRG